MQDSSQDNTTIIIDGVEKSIRYVTYNEFNHTISDDFLVVVDYSTTKEELEEMSLETNPSKIKTHLTIFQNGLGETILLKILDTVVAEVTKAGMKWFANSGVPLTIAQKAASLFLAHWPIALALATGVAIGYFVWKNTQKSDVDFKNVYNHRGCVWSGPPRGGAWLCPYSAPFSSKIQNPRLGWT